MEYVLAHTFDVGPEGAWTNLLRMSRGLEFPELYINTILNLSVRNLDRPARRVLAQILGLGSTQEADNLLQIARDAYMEVYKDQVGNIIHIPLLGLSTFRVAPGDFRGRNTADENLRHNAAVMAGMIWEAEMRKWMHWRGLEWRSTQWTDKGLKWRQRFPRYGFFQTDPCLPSGDFQRM
jgi:hypothetical protein